MSEGTDARVAAIVRRMVALGWTEGSFSVSQDGPRVGAWCNYMVYRQEPYVVTDAWAGPDAGSDAAQVIIKEQPLQRASLRALATQPGKLKLRDVAKVVVTTAGAGQGIGDPMTGDPQGVPGALESVIHSPRIEEGPGGRKLVFFARLHQGGYTRLAAAMDGEGEVSLETELPDGPPIALLSGEPVPTAGPVDALLIANDD